jgi:hypothetical protein
LFHFPSISSVAGEVVCARFNVSIAEHAGDRSDVRYAAIEQCSIQKELRIRTAVVTVFRERCCAKFVAKNVFTRIFQIRSRFVVSQCEQTVLGGFARAGRQRDCLDCMREQDHESVVMRATV